MIGFSYKSTRDALLWNHLLICDSCLILKYIVKLARGIVNNLIAVIVSVNVLR